MPQYMVNFYVFQICFKEPVFYICWDSILYLSIQRSLLNILFKSPLPILMCFFPLSIKRNVLKFSQFGLWIYLVFFLVILFVFCILIFSYIVFPSFFLECLLIRQVDPYETLTLQIKSSLILVISFGSTSRSSRTILY